jgi:NAD dependent epimerase/dehydratase
MGTISGRRVLVTGAGGFIGGHVVEAAVRAGARVRALVRYNGRSDWGSLHELPPDILSEVEVIAGDIRDAHHVDKLVAGQDVVLHLAALIAIPWSYDAPDSYVQTNITGTLNVLEAVRRHGVQRMVNTSTSEVYGTARYVPIDEKHPLQGQSPYSATKIGADKLAESYFLSFGTPVVTLRPFNTYGPRQSARAIIPTVASQLAAGIRELHLGSLDPVRDFLFVEDTARAFLLAGSVDGLEGDTIHVGTGVGVTIQETVERLCAVAGTGATIAQDPNRIRPTGSEVMRLICDPAKAKARLQFEPTVQLDEGLKRTYDSVVQRLDRYRPTQYQR